MQASTNKSTRRGLACVLTLMALLVGGAPTAGATITPTVSGVLAVKAGSVGVSMTIHGTGFEATPVVTSLAYDVALSGVTWLSSTAIRVTVNTHAGTALGPRQLKITNPGGTSVTCSCLTITWPYTAASPTTRPNIVVINTDDQRGDSISQMPSMPEQTGPASRTRSCMSPNAAPRGQRSLPGSTPNETVCPPWPMVLA